MQHVHPFNFEHAHPLSSSYPYKTNNQFYLYHAHNPAKLDNSQQLWTQINNTLNHLLKDYQTSIDNYNINDKESSIVNNELKREIIRRSVPEIHMQKQSKSKLRSCNDMN